MKTEKKQLHQSHLEMLFFCGEKFRRRYLLGEKVFPTTDLLTGSIVHETSALDLTHKVETKGTLLKAEAVQDAARDSAVRLWSESPLLLNETQKEMGLSKVKGELIDKAVILSSLHHTDLAPLIFPVEGGIEKPWVIECNGYPFDLSGTMDIDEGVRLRDTKTAKQAPGQLKINKSMQFTFYSMAKFLTEKVFVLDIYCDVLLKLLTPRIQIYHTTRDMADFAVAKARFEIACRLIEKEIFMPADSTHFLCSPNYCGFYNDCKYVNGSKSIPVSTPINNIHTKQRRNNGTKRKRIIASGSDEWLKATS